MDLIFSGNTCAYYCYLQLTLIHQKLQIENNCALIFSPNFAKTVFQIGSLQGQETNRVGKCFDMILNTLYRLTIRKLKCSLNLFRV